MPFSEVNECTHNRNADSWSRFTWKAIHFKTVYKSEFNRLQPFTGNLIKLMRWMMMTCRLILRCYYEIYLSNQSCSDFEPMNSAQTHKHFAKINGWMQRAKERIQLKQSLAKLHSPFDGLGVTCRFYKRETTKKSEQAFKQAGKRTNERSFIKSKPFSIA